MTAVLRNGQLQSYSLADLAKLSEKVQGSKNVIIAGDPQTVTNFSIGKMRVDKSARRIVEGVLYGVHRWREFAEGREDTAVLQRLQFGGGGRVRGEPVGNSKG